MMSSQIRRRYGQVSGKSSLRGARIGCAWAWLRPLFAILLLLGLMASQLALCQEQVTVESRRQRDSENLAEAMAYLETLERISEASKPRFGRSAYKQQPRYGAGNMRTFSSFGDLPPLPRFANEPARSSAAAGKPTYRLMPVALEQLGSYAE